MERHRLREIKCTHTHTHERERARERERERGRESETGARGRQRETERETDRQTKTDRDTDRAPCTHVTHTHTHTHNLFGMMHSTTNQPVAQFQQVTPPTVRVFLTASSGQLQVPGPVHEFGSDVHVAPCRRPRAASTLREVTPLVSIVPRFELLSCGRRTDCTHTRGSRTRAGVSTAEHARYRKLATIDNHETLSSNDPQMNG